MLKVYVYSGCSTCRAALKWLRAAEIEFQEVPIRETPPSKAELKVMLNAYDGDLRRLFNTSGTDYRVLGMKEQLPTFTPGQALAVLAETGNLIKRPFAIDPEAGIALVGFQPEAWNAAFAR